VEGMLLVLVVLVAFLGIKNWRSALIVASVIPLALLGAAMLLDYQKIPANLISMGAIDFVPLFTLQRVEGRIFKPMALTLSFAIVAGALLALVAVPCFASYLLRAKERKEIDGKFGFGLVRAIRGVYLPVLDLSLRLRFLV